VDIVLKVTEREDRRFEKEGKKKGKEGKKGRLGQYFWVERKEPNVTRSSLRTRRNRSKHIKSFDASISSHASL
jgi:hypothetical protein